MAFRTTDRFHQIEYTERVVPSVTAKRYNVPFVGIRAKLDQFCGQYNPGIDLSKVQGALVLPKLDCSGSVNWVCKAAEITVVKVQYGAVAIDQPSAGSTRQRAARTRGPNGPRPQGRRPQAGVHTAGRTGRRVYIAH